MAEDQEIDSRRAFTPKAILFGLAGVLLIAGFTDLNDYHISGGTPMICMHLAVAPFVLTILLAAVWNGLFSRILPAMVLNSRELMVIMCMMLVAGFPPGSGLMRYFNRLLMMPWFHLKDRPEWVSFDLLGMIPAKLFPSPVPTVENGIVKMDDTVYRAFFSGMATGNNVIPFMSVPWKAWMPAVLTYWTPLFLFFSVCIMSLSLLVHRQWVHFEQLSYPLAQVASALITRKQGKGVADVFRSPLFWWGFSPLMFLYALGYLNRWFPEYVPGFAEILPNVKNWSVDLVGVAPVFKKVIGPWDLQGQSILFSIVGLSYFVSSEISLTMGLSHILLALVGVTYFGFVGEPMRGEDLTISRVGSYFGYALILLFTGRVYYWAVLKQSVGLAGNLPASDYGVMALRMTAVSFVGMVIMLTLMGMDWLIAICFSATMMMLFVCFSRIICETGIPFLQANWFPSVALLCVMGPEAIGPAAIVLIFFFSTILVQDPRECLMPFVATSLRMADDMGMRLKKIFWVMLFAIGLAMVIGFIAKNWADYNFGAVTGDSWTSQYASVTPFDTSLKNHSFLRETGTYAESESRHGLSKLALISPDRTKMWFLFAGIALVILFSSLRFRFAGFPIHPVLFLVWGAYPPQVSWASFLIGWVIKTLVVKFGGGKVYQNLKPIFIGLIAAELCAAAMVIVAGLIYFWVTGVAPDVSFQVLKG